MCCLCLVPQGHSLGHIFANKEAKLSDCHQSCYSKENKVCGLLLGSVISNKKISLEIINQSEPFRDRGFLSNIAYCTFNQVCCFLFALCLLSCIFTLHFYFLILYFLLSSLFQWGFLHIIFKAGILCLHSASPFCVKGKEAEWGVFVVPPLSRQWR